MHGKSTFRTTCFSTVRLVTVYVSPVIINSHVFFSNKKCKPFSIYWKIKWCILGGWFGILRDGLKYFLSLTANSRYGYTCIFKGWNFTHNWNFRQYRPIFSRDLWIATEVITLTTNYNLLTFLNTCLGTSVTIFNVCLLVTVCVSLKLKQRSSYNRPWLDWSWW